jgi:hypothetical protein
MHQFDKCRRIFSDGEYAQAGATMTENLTDASLIVGVKKMPEKLFADGKSYLFFRYGL